MKVGFLLEIRAALVEQWFEIRASCYVRVFLTMTEDSQDTKPWARPYFDLTEDQTRSVSPHPRGPFN